MPSAAKAVYVTRVNVGHTLNSQTVLFREQLPTEDAVYTVTICVVIERYTTQVCDS